VVPGITAAVGAAAYAGIPLTDRDHAAGVRFVTARRAPAGGEDPLQAHAPGNDTLAVYMGRAQLQQSARTLLEGGRDAATPVALVENATRANQRVLLTTLGELADDARGLATPAGATGPDHAAHRLAGPVMMIVGDCAALAGSLHWFGRAPETLALALERAS
jgi:uroporphyrin-III C-methyltransferase/precorrin-2 dehydrogenase/sirohydrochlorin ferrochelatase